MEPALVWLAAGAFLMLLEIVVPGGVVVFLGLAAAVVGAALYLGWEAGIPHALIAWFVLSIALLLGLRSFFMKFFEGDSTVQNVSETEDYLSAVVDVTEAIEPYREGRVLFRGVTWQARSEESLAAGARAVITDRDGNTWIVKAL